jgi:hypothetical protein
LQGFCGQWVTKLKSHREALIEELRREREDNARRIEQALKNESELISGAATILDPFSSNKGEV